jgi:hypothetical protein
VYSGSAQLQQAATGAYAARHSGAANVIVLFTDFGLQGPYTGQMKTVLYQMAACVPAIDLFADAPVGNPKASAYLLAAYAEWFAAGTAFLAAVDLGVGGTRSPIILEADGRWYVGPGNGLFETNKSSWDMTGSLSAFLPAVYFAGATSSLLFLDSIFLRFLLLGEEPVVTYSFVFGSHLITPPS